MWDRIPLEAFMALGVAPRRRILSHMTAPQDSTINSWRSTSGPEGPHLWVGLVLCL